MIKDMEIIKTEKQIKPVEVIVDNYTLCDKCNEKIKKESIYDAFECEFIHKTGDKYPEGGSGEKQDMQLCQKCAILLIDLLKANGYRVNDSKWDW